MNKKVLAFIIIASCLFGPSAFAGQGSVEMEPDLGILIKTLYTHRTENERTGVDGIDLLALRWVGLTFSGEMGRVDYRLEVVASRGIYRDPILMTGTTAVSAMGEFGTVGIREAKIGIKPLEWAKINVGTIIPEWGTFQGRSAAEWEFVDLPMIYTAPAFRNIGWQNAGVEASLSPIDEIKISGFYVNGYMPDGLANSEQILPSGAFGEGRGVGGRARIKLGPAIFHGGYYTEEWEEDVRGGPDFEGQEGSAWIAGIELEVSDFWFSAEWTDLVIEDYQLKISDGTFVNLRAYGGHVDLAWQALDAWRVLVRWEWIDPNDANSRSTQQRSRFDQVTQWTVGVNYRLSENTLLMANYVTPIEEGSHVNIPKGDLGGKYQERENNYFRVQLQVVR